MKLNIVGASAFVDRMHAACAPHQWAREFLVNAIEAGAHRVEFGIEWQAVEQLKAYRRTIADDGAGMSAAELLKFFSTLGAGAKKIGGVHDNFGVGAKIASLPWNPAGVVVLSRKAGITSMIWIQLRGSEYDLREFEIDGTVSCVIDPARATWPEVDWSKVMPPWVEHGTCVVLLGSEGHPHTIQGDPDSSEADIKGLSTYLNTRFWDLTALDVRVVEVRGEAWPRGPLERDDTRRPNRRRAMGADFYLTKVKGDGRLEAAGALDLCDGKVRAEWFLWAGERPKVQAYARRQGYVAVRHRGEIYWASRGKTVFRSFGIVEGSVQERLTIILDPKALDGTWGVHPDQSRSRLIFTGDGLKGAEPPIADWGLQFAAQLPDEVLAAIVAARSDVEAGLDDTYRQRLQDRFGDRWRVKAMVAPFGGQDGLGGGEGAPEASAPAGGEGRPSPTRLPARRAAQGGAGPPVEGDLPVDVPRIRFGHAAEFEEPWHAALWAPNAPGGPTVVVNVDAPVILEAVRWQQNQYPDVFADEVARIVRQVYGEVAACKAAHVQKLAAHVPVEVVDRDYRSEAALTAALMGLLAEESLIGQRLSKLGRKVSS